MGNTSSVIDGEPSHAPRALLLRRWRAVFPSLSAFASDWPAVLSHPALLYPRSPIGRESIKTGTKADSPDGLYCSGERILPPYAQLMGNRSTGCEIAFQSHCHSPCAGLSPAILMMGNRFCPTTWHYSPEHHHTDIPQEVKSCLQSASAFRCRNRPPHSKVVTRRLLF